ncbi:MAG: TrkA family potassium uptake protein [Candidatus Wallbacteria bacterium]|nr:TrkA family potassium uptake protein [Candidatus Wallbacteria bacterium]
MQVAVIGLGRFGAKVAEVLAARGAEVLAIDRDTEICEELKDRVTQSVALDSTDEKSLRAAGVQEMDLAVVAIGANMEASIMTTALLRRLGLERVIARAVTALQGAILREVGASEVVFLEDQMGEQVALRIVAPQLLERITLGSGHSLAELRPLREFVGKTIRELDLRNRHGVNVIALKRRRPVLTEDGRSAYEVRVNDLPMPDDRIESDDVLVVVGSREKVDALTKLPGAGD